MDRVIRIVQVVLLAPIAVASCVYLAGFYSQSSERKQYARMNDFYESYLTQRDLGPRRPVDFGRPTKDLQRELDDYKANAKEYDKKLEPLRQSIYEIANANKSSQLIMERFWSMRPNLQPTY